MSSNPSSLAIVFADISGSTRYYETLGDETARALIAASLSLMTDQVHRFNGTVIKTIGDEIMCTFPTAAEAIEAAVAMQAIAQDDITEGLHDPQLASAPDVRIRIGLHYGPVIAEEGDVFGDAVNVASRMSSLAKGGQIITTGESVAHLPASLEASTRLLDRVAVKGKADEMDIHEVIWQTDDVTRMASGLVTTPSHSARMTLQYSGAEIDVSHDNTPFLLGRGRTVDLVINDRMASREHARIECRRGKFILTDVSTNGTWVTTPSGPSYLRRDNALLSGRGQISLGRAFEDATDIITFDCGN